MTDHRPTLSPPDRSAARRLPRLLAAATALSLPLAGLTLPAVPASAGAECGTNGITVTSLNPPMFYTDLVKGMDSGYAGYEVTSADARKNLWIKLSGFTGGQLTLNADQPAELPLGNLTAGQKVPSFSFLTASAASKTPIRQNHVVEVYAGRPSAAGSTLLCTTSGGFAGVQDTIEAGTNNVRDINGDLQAVYLSTSTPQLGQTITVRVEGVTGLIGAGTTIDPNALYMTPTALKTWPSSAFRLTGTALRISPYIDNNTTLPMETFTNVLRRGNLGSGDRPYEASYSFTATGATGASTQLFPIQQIASGNQIKHTSLDNLAAIPQISPVQNPLRVSLTPSSTELPSTGGTVTYTATLSSTSSVSSQVDELVFTLPDGATYAPGSATVSAASTADPLQEGQKLTFSGPFTTNSAAPVVVTVSVQIPGTPGSYTTDAYGLLAGTVIDTSSSTVDSVPAATAVTVAAAEGTSAQSISFPELADTRIDHAAPLLQATASSGLAVSYASTTPDECSVSAGAVTMLQPGTCTVRATQAGDGTTWSAAPPVSRSFVIAAAPQSQVITFGQPADGRLGGTAPDLIATATSQLPVTFTSTTPQVCTVDQGVLSMLSEGSCTISAAQGGDAAWEPAPSVTRTFTVLPAAAQPAAQTIDFGTLPATKLRATPPSLSASATSQLPVGFASTTPTVCTVDQGVLTMLTEGECTVEATQDGSTSWQPATPVRQSFTVLPADAQPAAQTIDFGTLPDLRIDAAAPVLAAKASSQLPVTYTSTTPDHCSVTDGVVTMKAPGTCTIEATQAGSNDWLAAATVARSFTISPVPALVVSQPGSGSTIGTVPAPVTLPGLPAGAVLTVSPQVVDAVRGVASVAITGGTVQVVAERDFSGVITLPVTVTADGQSVVVEVKVVVLPVPAVTPTRSLAGPSSSKVAWTPSPNATGYEVRLNGVVVCTTVGTSCTLPGLVGPNAKVEITALGNDATRSTIVLPPYQQRKGVHVTDVYFATDSAKLSRAARGRLDKVARVMIGQGFRHVLLSGHTDSRASVAYNRELSKRRALSVKRYLDGKLARSGVSAKVSFFASKRPAAPNNTARGRALNRRTEVSLR